jgi:hypothetical protein
MSSERRIQSSRTNGAKSRGPKTPDSKRRSTAHNTHHGLLARTIVLEDENLQSFTDLADAIERALKPQNEIERELIENLAATRWRLLRLWSIERSSLIIEMVKNDPALNDPSTRAAMTFRTLSDESRSLELLNRYETRLDRQWARSLNLLLKMQRDRLTQIDFCHRNPVPNSNT